MGQLGRRLATVVLCVVVGVGGMPPIPGIGDAGADFGAGQAARYNKNVNGDFLLIGNTVLKCNGSGCTTNNTVNDDLDMVNNDPDGAGALFNGSSATFTIPAGSVVDAAYLYWGANLGTTRNSGADFYCADNHAKASNATATKSSANTVQMKVGAGAYVTYTADSVYTQPAGGLSQSLPTGSSDDGLVYEGVEDVTAALSAVPAATATTVSVANIQAMQGENCHAGWSLTVVYRFPALNCLTGANDNSGGGANLRNDYRNVAIYDGLLRQQDGGADTTTTLSGFLTAQPGPDDLRLGVVAWEGDQFLTQDQMKVKSNLSASATTVDPAGPSSTSNFFDSGKQTTADHNGDLDANPDSGATIQQGYTGGRGDGHGIDAKTQLVQVPGGTSSIDVTFTTDSDQYYPGQFALSSPLKCLLIIEKDQAVNGVAVGRDNSTSPAPYVKAGDVLTYTLPVRVAGDVDLSNVVITDLVPANTTFVAGSISVAKSTTPAGALAGLASGGSFAANTVTANLGTMNNLTGASCAAGDLCYAAVRFQVTVNAGVSPGTVITNVATSTFTASGIAINEISNPVTDRVGALLTISKTITGAVAGDPSSFAFTISCGGNQVAGSPVSLANGGSTTIGVPPGSVCTVTEATNANFAVTVTGAITTNGGSTTMTQDRSVSFTNARQFGRIVVSKSTVPVAGDPQGTPTFEFTVSCPGVAGYPRTLNVTGSGSAQTPIDIPFGSACTVTETATPGWAQSGSQSVQPVNEATETVSFTNTRQTGSLVVNKTTVGGDGTFQFAVNCDGTAWDVSRTISTVGGTGQSTAVTGIPAGVGCSVTESPQVGWTPTGAPAGPVTIAAGQQATASFTNTRQTADLVITKVVSGTYALPVSGSFDFQVNCGSAGTFDRTISASSSANGTATVSGLPVGTSCTITEIAPSGWTLDASIGGNTNGRVVVIAEQGNGATFTNRRAVGSVVIDKTIDQGSGTFRFDLTCGNVAVPGSPFDITINAPATNGSVSVPNIPTGSSCVVDENPNGSVDGDFVQVTPAGNGVVTFASTGATQTASFVDHRRVGDLVIRKVFPQGSLGDPNQVFTFQWDCGPQPRTIGLKAGQQHVVSGLPTGTSCTVSETANADYSSVTSPPGGAVTIVEGSNTVTVTNTRKTGTIEVRKHLVPAADPGRFDLNVDGGAPEASGVGDGGTTGAIVVPIGAHGIAEAVAAGTAADINDYSVAVACVNTVNQASVPVTQDNNVVVAEGAKVVCTFTNTRKTGSLTLTKVVVDPLLSGHTFDLLAGADVVVDNAVNGSSGSIVVNTGSITVSETGAALAGYTTTISCSDGQQTIGSTTGTSLQVNVTSDARYTCTFINMRAIGTLEVRKVLSPANDSGRFDLSIDGTVRTAAAGNGDSTGPVTVAPGSHTIGEAATAGSSLGDYVATTTCVDTADNDATVQVDDGAVQVGANDAVVCTITNTRRTGAIEVRKSLSPTNDPGTFDLSVNGTVRKAGATHNGTTGEIVVQPGVFTIAEAGAAGTALADYTATLNCVDTARNNAPVDSAAGTVQVDSGDDIVCTFTNTRTTGNLTLTKVVVDPFQSGHTFDLLAGQTLVVDDAVDGSSGSTTANTGTITVSEIGADLAGYTSSIACTSGGQPLASGSGTSLQITVAANADVVCTFTNVRKTGTLEVRKQLSPTNDPGTFDLSIDGTVRTAAATHNGTTGAITVVPGSHIVAEAGASGTTSSDYAPALSCVNTAAENAPVVSTGGNVNVAAGATVVCTFTNTRKTGSLTLTKVVVDPLQSGHTFDLLAGANVVVDEAVNGSTGTTVVNSGMVTVSEAGADLAAYASSIACTNGGTPVVSGSGTSLQVNVPAGADVVCTFTNTRLTGTIEVRKSLSPTNDPGTFDLSIDGVVRKAGASHDGTTGARAVVPGAHTVAEAASGSVPLAEYTSTVVCVDTAHDNAAVTVNGGSVTVDAGDAIVCTFTNTRKAADLTIVKSPGSAYVRPGGVASFTIEVSNAAGAGTARDVVVSDPLPEGVTYLSSEGGVCDPDGTVCALGDIAPGASTSFTISYTVGTDPTLKVVHNEVTVTSPDDPESPGDDADIPVSRIALVKTGSPGSYAEAGDVLTYTYVVSNTGGAGLTGVTVTDDKIATDDIDCNGDDAGNGQPFPLAVGASVTCVATATVTAEDIAQRTVVNVATADSDQTGPVESEWSIPLAAIAIDKVTTSSGPFALGDLLEFEITVTNTGVATLHGVTIVEAGVGAVLADECDASPSGEGVTLEPGESITCEATHVVTQTDFDTGSYTNVAKATSDETPDVTDEVTVSTPDPAVDLAITKALNNSSLVVGQQATYTLTVRNNGPATATSVTVTDALPTGLVGRSAGGTGWTCAITSNTVTCTTASSILPAATMEPISVVVDVTTSAVGTVTNTAKVTGTQVDRDPTNNTSTVTNPVTVVEARVVEQTTTTAPRTTTTVAVRVQRTVDDRLAVTGGSAVPLLAFGGLLLLGGSVMVALRSKRRS